MPVESCIPVIPSKDLEKSLRLRVEGLGFLTSSEMRRGRRLTLCMLRNGDLWFMLNQGSGNPDWAPKNIRETRERLKSLGYSVSGLEKREYGQTESFLTMTRVICIVSGFRTRRMTEAPKVLKSLG